MMPDGAALNPLVGRPRYSLEGAEFALRISGTARTFYFRFRRFARQQKRRTAKHRAASLKFSRWTSTICAPVQQERGETAPETERVQTEDGAVDFEIGADEEQFNMVFPQGSENASPSEPFSDSSKSFANSPSPRADQLQAKGERPQRAHGIKRHHRLPAPQG